MAYSKKASFSRSKERYNLLKRNAALARLKASAGRGSVLARKQLHGIKTKTWQNMRKLYGGLMMKNKVHRYVKGLRGRIASKKSARVTSSYNRVNQYPKSWVGSTWKSSYRKRKR